VAKITNHPRLIFGIGVLFLCIVSSASLYLWNPFPLQVLRNATFDQFQRLKPRIYQDTPVRIINIDDESLSKLGQWPWPRTRIAELLNILQIAKPKTIAVDIIFAEKDRSSPLAMLDVWNLNPENRQLLSALPDHDQILANAIQHSNTVLGFALTQNESQQTVPIIPARYVQIGESPLSNLSPFNSSVSSLPMLQKAATGHGALTFVSDADGVIRKCRCSCVMPMHWCHH
jgi:adenylate cyclase